LQLLSNGSPNIPQLPHVDPDFAVPAKGVSDIETPSLNRNQRHPEGLGPASSHSQSRHPIDDVDPFPNEGSSTYTPPSPSLLRPNELHLPYFPQTPLTRSPEFDINTNTRCGIAPLQYDHTATPATPSRDISWMIHPNDFGDFSAATVAYGSMRDNRTSLGTRSIYSTSSRQTPVITHSAIHTTNCPSNDCGSIDLYSSYGYVSAPRNFRSASQRRHHTAGVRPIASSQVSASRRIPKKYWCETCHVGFTQKQGLQRHSKDVHGSRQLCPHCRDFEWSLGRKYTLRKHFKEMHPGVALPEMLQRQDTGGSLLTLA
jgi:hypothetical protein